MSSPAARTTPAAKQPPVGHRVRPAGTVGVARPPIRASRLLRAAIAGMGLVAWGLASACGPKIPLGPRNGDGDPSLQVRMESAHDDSARKGIQLAKAGDYRGAAAAFQQSTRARPEDEDAHFNLGLMAEKLGDYRTARDAYARAAQIDNKSKFREGQVRAQRELLAAARAANPTPIPPAVALNPLPPHVAGPRPGDPAPPIPLRDPRFGAGRDPVGRPGGVPRDLRLPGETVPDEPKARPVPVRPPADGPLALGPTNKAGSNPGVPTKTPSTKAGSKSASRFHGEAIYLGPVDPRDVPRPVGPVGKSAEPVPAVPADPTRPPAVPDPLPMPVPVPADPMMPVTGNTGSAADPKPVVPPMLPTVVEPPARGLPRVLVVGPAVKPDAEALARRAGSAAGEVEWQLLQLGGVRLVDRAALEEGTAAMLDKLTGAETAEELAGHGRAAGADWVVVVTATLAAPADFPNRLDGEVKARIVRSGSATQLAEIAAKHSDAGDRQDTVARSVVATAADALAKSLKSAVVEAWNKP